MKRGRRKRILLEPTADTSHQTTVVKIQVRPVAKELEMLVTRSSQGFEHIYRHWICAADLRGNTEIHG
jgi:hypothetical protein